LGKEEEEEERKQRAENFCWKCCSLFSSIDVIKFQTT
jgi:hypothetical protein